MKKLLGAFGLALVASFVLSALGVASASAAAPVNTALPVVTAAPKVGQVASTTNGTWTGSPTSYTYIWFRCNASGVECKSISGATSATYTPAAADVGGTLLTSVTATNAEGKGVALSNPSGVVTGLYWYACKNVGEGKGIYGNSLCATEGGSKAWAWSKLTEGAATAFKIKNSTSFNFTWPYVLSVNVNCSTLSASGSIQNPVGKGNGIATGIESASFSGCTVTAPKETGCIVSEGKIPLFKLEGVATELEGKPALRLQPAFGPEFMTLSLEKCNATFSGLNGSKKFVGSLTGILNGSSMEFTKASSKLSYNNGPAWFEGTGKIETGVEVAAKLAP